LGIGSEDGPTATTDPSRHISSNHYPIMPLADICVLLPVSELATEMLFDALHELDPTEMALEIVRTQLSTTSILPARRRTS
jgi:hypothetical protein